MNVKLAFLNGNLEEKIYGKQSPQFVVIGEEQNVCKLKKALYELKQEPRAWNYHTIFPKYEKCLRESFYFTS